jgi:hypothetical protein
LGSAWTHDAGGTPVGPVVTVLQLVSVNELLAVAGS